MKTRIRLIIISLFLPIPTFANFYNVGAGNSCLVLRSKASSRSSAQQCLKSGSQVQVVNYNPRGYSKVMVNGKPGYMWTKFLKPAQKPGQPVQYPVAGPHPVPANPESPAAGPAGMPALPGSGSEPLSPQSSGPAPRPSSASTGNGGNTPGEPTYTSRPANIDANPDMWKSVLSVTSEGHLPAGGGYNLYKRNWPKLVDQGGKLTLAFPNGKIKEGYF